jgi:hypothetical protein
MFADAGIPLIGPVICLGWFTIVPVVAIETIIAVWLLRWRFTFALRWVASANVLTMLLGFPVTWFLCAVASTLTGGGGWGDGSIIGVLKGPAWLGPAYIKDLSWAAPLALIVLCVPFFLMSWWIEYLLLFNLAVNRDKDQRASIRNYAWKANLASYALLVALLVGTMLY